MEAEFYRAHTNATPVWQGDVFDDVPLVKAKAGGSASSKPDLSIERRAVMVKTYACDLYQPGTARLSRVVAVVPLVDVTGSEQSAWRGAMYSRCPLCPTTGTDRVYSADLQVPSTVDGTYLVPEKRVHALSRAALAFFHQRLIKASTRVVTPLDYHEAQLGPVEHERDLWEGWVNSGGNADDFEGWLDTPLANAGGATPRRWLDQGSFAFLDQAARQGLQALGLSPAF